jgi:hypothetical protein
MDWELISDRARRVAQVRAHEQNAAAPHLVFEMWATTVAHTGESLIKTKPDSGESAE